MNLLKTKFRRGVFRSFKAWYAQNHERFWATLSLVRRTEKLLELAVNGIPKEFMTIVLTRQHGAKAGLDASIAFWLNGQNIDLLGWFDAWPQRISQGYICSVCASQGDVAPYQTLGELWEREVFEALLSWINSTLASHVRIDFYATKEGISWVEFVSQDDIVRRGGGALQTLSYNFHNTLH